MVQNQICNMQPYSRNTFNLLLSVYLLMDFSQCSNNDVRLMKHLFKNYNKHVRPATYVGQVTNVTIYLTLLQLISLTEKNEEMTTSQYLTLRWDDTRLSWNPSMFEGLTLIRLPSTQIWKPDIALYNNNDGEYDTTVPVNALLNYMGQIEWMPAAIYKSACKIKVDLFPFDWQNCTMKFKSFTYDKTELYIESVYDKVVVDKEAYRDNGEWTIIHCPIKTNGDPADERYQDITVYYIIQRKPLFYVFNIIIPCVLIASLSILVFYLPSASNEKMSMGISILLGITVYLLLLAKRVPETSLGVPLIGAYLLFTMLMVTLSITCSVVVLNVHYRPPSTSKMPDWVRSLFLNSLPTYLLMKKPRSKRKNTESLDVSSMVPLLADNIEQIIKVSYLTSGKNTIENNPRKSPGSAKLKNYSIDALVAAQTVLFIANNVKVLNINKKIIQEWNYVAMVIDRLLMIIFFVVFFLGTIYFVLLVYNNSLPEYPFQEEGRKYANCWTTL